MAGSRWMIGAMEAIEEQTGAPLDDGAPWSWQDVPELDLSAGSSVSTTGEGFPVQPAPRTREASPRC